MTRNPASILICLLLCFSAASCEKPGDRSAVTPSENENILRFDVTAPFTSLNPARVEASGSTVIFPLLYSYLFVPDVKGELQPDLAKSWSYDQNSFAWTIRLRTDARFHNSRPVTAKDVIDTFKVWLQNVRPSLMASIHGISCVSDSTLCIRLTKNDPDFVKKIWHMEVIPASDKGRIDYYNHPVGSGPFAFKSRNRDKQVVLTANDNYYNGRPAIDGVVFTCHPDKEKAWTRLLSGATDIAREISPKNYEIMKQYENRFYFDQYTLKFYSILLYNTRNPLFSDPRVRRALTRAIDRKYIVDHILNGFARVAAGPMGIGSPYHDPDLHPLPYDPKKSLDLLFQAGWAYDEKGRYLYKNNRPFEFTLLVLDESRVEKRVARYIRLCLNDIGIKMNLSALPYDEFEKRFLKNNDFQAVLTEFTGAYDKPEYLKVLWTPEASGISSAGYFDDPGVTRLLNQALAEKDPEKQKECLYKLDSLIALLQPGSFLYHKTAIDVMSRRFNLSFPFTLSHEGIYRLRFARLSEK